MISGTRYQLTLQIAQQRTLASRVARAQSDIATQKRIATPSDDPAAAGRVAELARETANEATWAANVRTAAARAAQADGTLTTVANALDRARELLIGAANGTLSDSDRIAAAVELRGIAVDLGSYQNVRDSSGQPIFATSAALLVPISDAVEVASAGDAAQVFGNVPTSGGPATLVAILNAAALAVEDTNPATRPPAIRDALDSVVKAIDHVNAERAVQGVRAARLDAAANRFAELAVVHEDERSGLEDTDIAATTMRLNANQLSLQAAQSVFARVNRSTLFDLIG